MYSCRCGHCKRLAPEYEKAATELKRNDPQVPLAKVRMSNVCSCYRITIPASISSG